jgi:hypothetical protein
MNARNAAASRASMSLGTASLATVAPVASPVSVARPRTSVQT